MINALPRLRVLWLWKINFDQPLAKHLPTRSFSRTLGRVGFEET